jgi:hypothetical protein
MPNLIRRAAAGLRASWPRLAFAAALVAACLLLAGDGIVVREFALNLLRVAAVLWTFEAFVRYSTRRMSDAVGPVAIAPGRELRAFRFGDLFRRLWDDPSARPLALFLVGNLAVRGALVVAVWR